MTIQVDGTIVTVTGNVKSVTDSHELISCITSHCTVILLDSISITSAVVLQLRYSHARVFAACTYVVELLRSLDVKCYNHH